MYHMATSSHCGFSGFGSKVCSLLLLLRIFIHHYIFGSLNVNVIIRILHDIGHWYGPLVLEFSFKSLPGI